MTVSVVVESVDTSRVWVHAEEEVAVIAAPVIRPPERVRVGAVCMSSLKEAVIITVSVAPK